MTLAPRTTLSPIVIKTIAVVGRIAAKAHLLWHERFTLDPGHAWLRDMLAEGAQAAQSPVLDPAAG